MERGRGRHLKELAPASAAPVPLKLRCVRTLFCSAISHSWQGVGILLFYFVAYLPFSFGHFGPFLLLLLTVFNKRQQQEKRNIIIKSA